MSVICLSSVTRIPTSNLPFPSHPVLLPSNSYLKPVNLIVPDGPSLRVFFNSTRFFFNLRDLYCRNYFTLSYLPLLQSVRALLTQHRYHFFSFLFQVLVKPPTITTELYHKFLLSWSHRTIGTDVTDASKPVYVLKD